MTEQEVKKTLREWGGMQGKVVRAAVSISRKRDWTWVPSREIARIVLGLTRPKVDVRPVHNTIVQLRKPLLNRLGLDLVSERLNGEPGFYLVPTNGAFKAPAKIMEKSERVRNIDLERSARRVCRGAVNLRMRVDRTPKAHTLPEAVKHAAKIGDVAKKMLGVLEEQKALPETTEQV